MGQKPRCFKPNTVYEQTQRTVDRQFLFAPINGVRNAFGAAAARAQKKHPVKLYWLEINSNHEHLGIGAVSDSKEHLDNMVNFKRTYHRIVAEELNRLYDRSGAIFSTPARTTECLDDKSTEQQMFYALLNPVKDNLVKRVEHWKGFSSYSQIAKGKDEIYTYYDRTTYNKQKLNKDAKPLGAFLKTIQLKFSKLPHLENKKDSQYQAGIRREVKTREQHFDKKRTTQQKSVLGTKKLAKTNPRHRPKNPKKSGQKPLCHCSCNDRSKAYADQMTKFYQQYIIASAVYRNGAYNTEFPYGSIKPPLMGVTA